MTKTVVHPSLKRTHLALLILFCLVLPNIHITALASQVVLPREFFLYLYTTVFVLFLTQWSTPRHNGFFIVSLIFLLWQSLALAWSSDLSAGVEGTLNSYAFLLSGFVLYQVKDHDIRTTLLNCLIISVSFAALIGILQNFDWNPLDIHQSAPPSSTFNNKNLAASAALLFLPVMLSKLLVSNHWSEKLLFALSAFTTFSFILVSHTKGVWLAGLCLLFIAIMTYRRCPPTARLAIRQDILASHLHLLAIVTLSVVIFVLPGARNTANSNIDDYSLASNSVKERMGFYSDALPLIAQNPFIGIGSGSLRREFRSEPDGAYERQHAQGNRYLNRLHNDHLQYLVEQGLVGLTLWLALLYFLFKTSIQHLSSTQDSTNNKLIVYALLLGILGMLLHALVSFPLRSVSTGSLFWLAIGLMLSHQNDGEQIGSNAIPARIKSSIVALLLIISVFAIYNLTHRAIGSYYHKQATEILPSGYCFAAKFYLNNLLETTSLDLRAAQLLALTYDYCGGESPEKTVALMDSILAFEPNHSLALLIKADNAYRLGEYDTAYALYLHAQQVNPEEPRAYLGMAKIAAADNRRAEAMERLNQVLEMDSENPEAREMLNALKTP